MLTTGWATIELDSNFFVSLISRDLYQSLQDDERAASAVEISVLKKLAIWLRIYLPVEGRVNEKATSYSIRAYFGTVITSSGGCVLAHELQDARGHDSSEARLPGKEGSWRREKPADIVRYRVGFGAPI